MSCTKKIFFFSSRRRHTSWPRDWSSDVCSSDLLQESHVSGLRRLQLELTDDRTGLAATVHLELADGLPVLRSWAQLTRSEERRVGKVWSARSLRYECKKECLKESTDGVRV